MINFEKKNAIGKHYAGTINAMSLWPISALLDMPLLFTKMRIIGLNSTATKFHFSAKGGKFQASS